MHTIVSAARSLTCRDDLDSKWRLLLAENELYSLVPRHEARICGFCMYAFENNVLCLN